MRPPSPPQQSDESGSTNSRASLIVVMLGLGATLQFTRLRILTLSSQDMKANSEAIPNVGSSVRWRCRQARPARIA